MNLLEPIRIESPSMCCSTFAGSTFVFHVDNSSVPNSDVREIDPVWFDFNLNFPAQVDDESVTIRLLVSSIPRVYHMESWGFVLVVKTVSPL